MESYRKTWMQNQTTLRPMLKKLKDPNEAFELFFDQHAAIHSAKMGGSPPWSFEDEILDDMSEDVMRRIPRNCEHSVAWCIWHNARIEDTAMNLLVAGTRQVLHQDNWLNLMQVKVQNTGNAMDVEAVADLSAAIDIEALRAYRVAVGCRTREIVKGLQPEDLKKRVDLAHIQRVKDQGVVVEAAYGITDYWSKRDIAGLLLMPATRHNFVHLNEAAKLKQRRK